MAAMLLQREPERVWGGCCSAGVHRYMTQCRAAAILNAEVLLLSVKRLTWAKVTLLGLKELLTAA